MACRFPGGIASPEAFWDFLSRGGEAIGEIGPERWTTDYYFHPDPKVPGKSYTWAAGVLDQVDGFDARFFGISPREAVQMDPQQRILLELAWEALEDAGCLPQNLAGSSCGVYVGISNMDYANSRLEDPCSGDAYFMTGGVLSIAANRISYFLDLHGPSMAIDTACSSSLVAVHQACESIARGECDSALVGGVNVLLTPYPFIGFSKASMLSPTGRCHAFDASADGYVRAEGGAMLVLKPLDKARADGDPVRAIIIASGTNSDGRTSGLSLPRESAQRELLRSVYSRAGLEPGQLRYIEAHGTGTAVGDPIEASAIGRALAMARDHDDPLLIGSVKTNIGHLEPAAGVAGLLKVVLSLEHDVIPPSLNFETPNPNIRFDDLNMRVVTRCTPLGNTNGVAAMGVNSFGFGGANAHVVVRKHQNRSPERRRSLRPSGVGCNSEAYCTEASASKTDQSSLTPSISLPLFISAQSKSGLADAARAFKATLSNSEHDLYDVCLTAATRRQHFDHRVAVVAADAGEMSTRLDQFIDGKPARGVVKGQTLGRQARLALLFSGNGAQWQGMGCRLLDEDPVFSKWMQQVDALFKPLSGVSILEELERPDAESRLHLTEIAQPALFAVQVGLFESMIARGLKPGAVFGHSVGEVAAAYACGAYTLEQATQVIYERSRAQAKTKGLGKIAAVGLSADAAREAMAHVDESLEIGAYNSPSSVTVTGTQSKLEALGEIVNEKGALFKILDFDYPFHSPAMDGLKKDLSEALYALNAFKTRIPFVSTVTGAVLDSEYLDAEYWWRNVRKPVRLDKAMATLMNEGFQVFLEVSPNAILQGYLRENLNAAGHSGSAVPSLKRDQNDALALTEALCASHVLGCDLDFSKLFPVHGEFVRLPHYPWQREKIWFERTSETFGLLNRPPEHPLLGYRLPQVDGIWEKEIDLERMPWLGDHVVGGAVVFPAAGFIEMALAASAQANPDGAPAVEYLNIAAPLVLSEGVTRRVRLELTADDGRFNIRSRPRLSSEAWTSHVSGRITRGAPPVQRSESTGAVVGRNSEAYCTETVAESADSSAQSISSDLTDDPVREQARSYHRPVDLSDRSPQTHRRSGLAREPSRAVANAPDQSSSPQSTSRIDADALYRQAEALGLRYGEAFRMVEHVEVNAESALARIKDEEVSDSGASGYLLSPARLDAAFHGLIGLAQTYLEDDSRAAFIPVHTGRIAHSGDVRPFTHARIQINRVRPRSVTASFELLDERARPIAVLKGVRFRRLELTHDARQTLPVYENVALRHFPKSLERAGAMPSLKSLSGVVRTSLTAGSALPHREAYIQHGLPAMERLVALFAACALGEGVDHNSWISRNGLAAALDVSDAQRPWFNRLIELLENAEFIQRDNGRIRFSRVPSLDEVKVEWQRLLAEFPAHHAELTLIGRCGLHLRELLAGAVAPDALIGGAALARLRAAFPGFRSRDGALRELKRHVVSAWSDPRPLRVLELGLEGDPPDIRLGDTPEGEHVEHVYARCRRSTCTGEADSAGAAEESSQALELVPEDSAEPLAEDGFDLVVVSHLLHEFDDPAAALNQMRRVLAPGGVLLVAEPPPTPVLDFIRGSSPCWWRSAEKSLGYRSTLRDADEWRQSLMEAGFEAVESVLEAPPDEGRSGFALIARNGSAASEHESKPDHGLRSFLLLCDRGGDSRRAAIELENILKAGGHRVARLQHGARFRRMGSDHFVVDSGEAGDFTRVLEILHGENRPCTDIVHLMGLSFEPDGDNTALLEVQERRCATSVRLVQALLKSEHAPDLRAWLVTARAGVFDIDDDAVNSHVPIPSQSSLWGLGRVIANEHSDIDLRLVDLLIDESAGTAADLIAAELDRQDGETEVVLTEGARYVSRIRRNAAPESARPPTPGSDRRGSGGESADEGAQTKRDSDIVIQLQTTRPGSLAELQWRPVACRPLGADEVAILPRAIGLNFRDVMFASGLLPEEAIENGVASATLGMECAGIVQSVGADVTKFEEGDEVMGFAPSCFSSRVVTGERALVKKPKDLSFEQAATAPVAFFTVLYALKTLAQLQQGERVLIHGAAGGVGIAAIQYARRVGAEIFATAGSDEKRDFLRMLGVPHVLDSRSLEFADQILAITNDQGVDVVLNSLSGEALARSLSVLKPFGRFLELGKRDFFENTRIGLRPFRENLSYFGIDADQLLIERPDVAGRVFEEVMTLFAEGVFRPLPYRVFPVDRAADAFRYMQRSEHIGKIVVARGKLPEPVRAAGQQKEGYTLKPDVTYLVTGGLSGFGLATAHWMVDQGARCLVLLGRSGANSDEAKTKIQELESLGAAVHVLKADVADFASLKNVFDHINAKLLPLKGLVHSAMVVDDKLIRDLDGKRMRRVLAPKLVGAWNLHALTREKDLDFLVLYSSATTSFGNLGLGNYVAANIYLESLARLRRSQGLPATAIAWGPISDSGYLARNDAALQALTSFIGSQGLTTRQGFEALGRLLNADITCGAVLDFDWAVVRRALPTAHVKRYEFFNREPDSGDAGEQPERSAKQILAQLPTKEARAVLTDIVVQTVARIMRLPSNQVDPEASIADLGMDSLMAIEMHMTLNNRLGMSLPVMGLADIPNIHELVDKIISHEGVGGGREATGEREKHSGANESAPIEKAESEERLAAHAAPGDD